MSAILDLSAVRQFTDVLTADVTRCGNGEGTECSTLETKCQHLARMSADLRNTLNAWIKSVFRGQLPEDAEVEQLFKQTIQRFIDTIRPVTESGTRFEAQCYRLEGLEELKWRLNDFTQLLANWVTPRLSVAPGPRVPLTAEVIDSGLKVIARMPGLPADWQPSTPEQRELLQQIRKSKQETK